MNSKALNITVFLVAILCVAVPCVLIQGQYLVNGNISWLLMAADRLLQGQSLSEHIYETNPPLSIMAYVPHVIFSKMTGLPLPVASFYVTSLFVIMSVVTVHKMIGYFHHLTPTQRLSFTACYLLSITLITTVFYSDREHLILLGLIPFVLCQFALMERIQLPRLLTYGACFIGALCVLIKPHYGLLPTVFLFSRMFQHRQWNFFKEIDFLALAIMTSLYIAVVVVFFADYITIILPDVITLYANSGGDLLAILNASQIHMLAYLAFFLFEAFREDLKQEQKRLVMFTYCCCLLCLVPYYVQMKGFYNHLVPAYAFFMMGLSMSLMFRTADIIKKPQIVQIIIPFVCLFSIMNALTPLNTDFPESKDIPNLPVAEYLEKNCEKPCSFFAFHGDIEIINPTAAYMGYQHATRFPSLWFLPQTLQGLRSENEEDVQHALMLKEKYTAFVAEDLTYYKPSILLIASDMPIGILRTFDFMSFFGGNEKLKKIMDEDYEKIEMFEYDRMVYFTGTTLEYPYTLKYDVYKRKN